MNDKYKPNPPKANIKDGSASNLVSTEGKTKNKLVAKYGPRAVKIIKSCLPERSLKPTKPPSDQFTEVLERASLLEQIPVAWVIIVTVLGALTWSLFATIEQFTVVTGRVVPQGNTIFVQHLEGGLVDEVLVSIGERVEEGQTLFRVSLSASNQTKDEVEAELAGLLIRRLRLNAEINNTDFIVSEDLINSYPDIVSIERKTFTLNATRGDRSIEIFQSQKSQQEEAVKELEATLIAQKDAFRLTDERLGIQKELEKDNLVSRFDVLDLEEKKSQLVGRIAELDAALASAKLKSEEASSKLAGVADEFRNNKLAELLKVENGIERLQFTLERYEQQNFRKDIRAPVTGLVKDLIFTQAGGVIAPGERLLELVPEGKSLIIEGLLPTSERGKVENGQSVLVKVSAYDFFRYGGLEGEVASISADSFVSQQGGASYRVTIKTDQVWLGELEGELPITPGMDVTADIKTGKRKVIEYIINPVLKLKHNAFRQ